MAFLDILVGGVVIGAIAACISFVCDELTEEEKSRQDQMRREYEAYEQRKKKEYQDARRYFEHERRQEERRYQEQLRVYQEELLHRRKEENRGTFQQLLKLWELQYGEKKKLLDECRKIVQNCEEHFQEQQHSYARFNSMKSTLLSLQEAAYKLEAYLRYMENYRDKLESLFEESGELSDPFSMTLPTDCPYEGKVIFLEKGDFSGYQYNFDSVGRIWLDKADNELFDNSGGRLPFMFYNAPNDRSYLSLAKGMLKNSIGGTIGLDMEVLKVFPSFIWLRFAHNERMKISISKQNLVKRNRRTPVGSNLHVFIKDYDFALKGRITVSERAEDGMSIAQFDTIAMVQTKAESNELTELYNYLKKNHLLDERDEWRIGPRRDKEHNLTGLILQQGANYAIQTAFQNLDGDKLVLRYEGRLPEKDFLSFDDVFVAANVTVRCYSHQKVLRDPDEYNAYFEECEKLRLYLTREFAVQQKMLARSHMSLYLDQWLEVTKRLIEYRAYGGHMRLKVDEWEHSKLWHSSYTLLHVEEEKYFQKFQEREAKKKRTRFFLELPGENRGRHNCRIVSDDENNIWLRTEGEIEEETLLELGFTVDLYSVDNAYTERQQANAFRMFKEGQVASETIKTAILNAGSYQYTDNGHRVTELFNQKIQTNPSQIDAVTRAFSEESFFLIQGPPGTGKTTVIKELILQQLNLNPNARIIVVSQANVAVDNVLRGIIQMDGQAAKIVRCGNEKRIAEDDIRAYSFERKFEDYRHKLHTDLPKDSKAQLLRQKWMQIMEDKGNADLVGECLLGCFQIIGATCLGLENRHYGLNSMEFDLVVIDEAGKALAGELLIPINRAKKVVIIGDHLQLPPVVDPALYKGGDVRYDDVVDQKQQYEFTQRSFFQRLYEECPDTSKCMLDVQFRMPPDIANLVSQFFYHGTLKTGANCIRKKPMFLGHHLIFVDMKDEPEYQEKQDTYQDGSKGGPYNEKELEAAAALVGRIRTCYDGRIVIITPYKKQKKRLNFHLEQENLLDGVSVNTIDAFQGDEADIVIYCTTRSRKPTDYFSDKARLNVAFSRARNTLIFLGSSNYLKKYPQDHILQDIGNYLMTRAAVVPYAQWMKIDLQYNADFSGMEEDGETTELIPIQNDFFQTQDKKDSLVLTCLACGKTLFETEDGLCAECINKIDSSHQCRCCKKKIFLPYFDIYLNGATVPELCVDCQEAHYEETICTECGKKFYIQHEQQEELLRKQVEVLCPNCEAYANALIPVGNCRHCGQTIRLTRRERNQRKNQQERLPIYCPDCEKQSGQTIIVGRCKHCHSSIEITCGEKWRLEKNRWSMPEYCKHCRSKLQEEVLIGYCKECCDAIMMTYQRKWQLEDEGKRMPSLCSRCWKESREKVTVGECEVCGCDITMSRLQYRKTPYRWYDLCKDCRNRVAEYERCTQCGEMFEITYGEKMSFEKKGLFLPKRCKICRRIRRW